jgi:dihydropteroate synthase
VTAVATGRGWQMRRGRIDLSRPVIVGILNLTPDSFSDGGRYRDPAHAVAHAHHLIEHGADMLDVGAESTRPGRPEPVLADEEWRRLEPVLAALVAELPRIPFSVDTVKSPTARRALEAGAWAINDVSGLRLDPEIADTCAAHGAGLVLMHSRGTVQTMATYERATYADVTAEVVQELEAATGVAAARGVPSDRIVVDPGFGFAKTPEQTYRVFRDLPELARLGLPVMVGPSRKRFLGHVTGRAVEQRDHATAAACVAAYFLGATLFRVHAAQPAREALDIAHAVRSA